MARVAIVGPGAIGCVLAAHLAATGRHAITLCARTPFEGELAVETPSGVLVARPRVIVRAADADTVDWVIVATKAYDSAAAASWLAALGGGPVAIAQNGVEHVERFAPFLPRERIVPLMVHVPAERVAPNRVLQRGPVLLVAGEDGLGRALRELFEGTAVRVELASDLRTVLWRKLCFNAAGALNALVLEPAAALRDEKLGAAALQLVRECIAVGRAEGAVLEEGLAERVLAELRALPPDNVNSLLADRRAGRPMEIDARNGAVVRIGRMHGVATPCNELAVALLERARRTAG